MFRAAFRRRVLVLLAVAAASIAVVGVASLAPSPGVASAQPPQPNPDDRDADGVPNSQDACYYPAQPGGKPGCPPFTWVGQVDENYGAVREIVEDGSILVASGCHPGFCTVTLTLTAGKKARKALGLKKALIGRKTRTQRSPKGVGFRFDLSLKALRKLEKLDGVDLNAKFEVSAPETPQMKAISFTKSGIVKIRDLPSRRRKMALNLREGTCPPFGQYYCR